MTKKNNDLLKAFAGLDKLNPEAVMLSETSLSNVSQWFNTGCMVLNSILSGSLYKGVPAGRITGFSGPSMTGKTFIINKVLANAQKDGLMPVIFDTEIAVDEASTRGVGLDPENTKYVPVNTIGDCRNQLFALLEGIEEQSLQGKFIVSIDSLGNLAGDKEMADAEKGKMTMDMGLRAKSLKSMMRLLTYKAAKTNTTILFSNHTYDDPAALYPSLVKHQSGGKGPVYLASVLVQLATRNEKQDENNEDDVKLPEANKYSGATLRALTVKNRFIPPFLQCEIYLNFKTGLDKYAGLKDMAVNHGVLIQNGSTYALPDGTKLGYYKNWKSKDELWEEKILPNLEKIIQEKYCYSS
jgi:RecA/RadA recombinase